MTDQFEVGGIVPGFSLGLFYGSLGGYVLPIDAAEKISAGRYSRKEFEDLCKGLGALFIRPEEFMDHGKEEAEGPADGRGGQENVP